MDVITFFLIEPEDNISCSEMLISIDSFKKIEVLLIYLSQNFHFRPFFDLF